VADLDEPHRARPLRRRRNLGKLLRISVFLGTFALSALANHQVGLPCWESVFAALQAFTLGLDTQPPAGAMAAGGLWPALVWTTRILAPLVAAESVLFVALLSGVVGRPRFLLMDHVVVIGAGNVGRSVAEHLIDRDGSDGTMLEVVVVDVNPHAPNLKELEEQGAWVVVGDGALPAVLHEARVESARAVIVVTDSDVANVAAMWNARSRCLAGARVYVHLEDEHLRETVTRALERQGDRKVEVFNLYEEAGALMVQREGLDVPDAPTRVVIAGFGRLGRAIHAATRVQRCLVVDKDPDVSVPHRDDRDERVCGAIELPWVVDRIARFVGETEGIVFVATDHDVRNLDLALDLDEKLAVRHPIRLVTRMVRFPGDDSDILARIGATSLSQLVATSGRFHHLAHRTEYSFRALVVRSFALISWWTGAV
jgi:hypothetical protein